MPGDAPCSGFGQVLNRAYEAQIDRRRAESHHEMFLFSSDVMEQPGYEATLIVHGGGILLRPDASDSVDGFRAHTQDSSLMPGKQIRKLARASHDIRQRHHVPWAGAMNLGL